MNTGCRNGLGQGVWNLNPRTLVANSAAPLPLVILVAAEGPRTVAEASPAATDAHEQMANSEFATSVPTFRIHIAQCWGEKTSTTPEQPVLEQ